MNVETTVQTTVHPGPRKPAITWFAITAFLVALGAGTACAPHPADGDETATHAIKGQTKLASDRPEACLVETDEQFCTGALLAPNVVLTAAHCLYAAQWVEVTCPYARDTGKVRAVQTEIAPSLKNRGQDPATLDLDDFADIGLVKLERPLAETRVARVSLDMPALATAVYSIGRVNQGKLSMNALYVSRQMKVSAYDTQHGFWFSVDFSVGEGGDSGGPVFRSDTNEIVGVEARGDICVRRLCELLATFGDEAPWLVRTFESFSGKPFRNGASGSDAGAGADMASPGNAANPRGATTGDAAPSAPSPDASEDLGRRDDTAARVDSAGAQPGNGEESGASDAGVTGGTGAKNPPPGRPGGTPKPPELRGSADESQGCSVAGVGTSRRPGGLSIVFGLGAVTLLRARRRARHR
jgi:Trypsin